MLTFILTLLTAEPASAAVVACPHDREALLALDVRTFDQTLGQGWRPLADLGGCEAAAADLIADYAARHASTLSEEDRQGLQWHEGQLRAAVGDYIRAAELMSEARADSPDENNRLYAVATVAFLRRDKPGLLAARERLAALPKDPGFDEAAARFKAQTGRTLTWPLNLDVVDGLIACFDKPYREAYSFVCRPQGAAVH